MVEVSFHLLLHWYMAIGPRDVAKIRSNFKFLSAKTALVRVVEHIYMNWKRVEVVIVPPIWNLTQAILGEIDCEDWGYFWEIFFDIEKWCFYHQRGDQEYPQGENSETDTKDHGRRFYNFDDLKKVMSRVHQDWEGSHTIIDKFRTFFRAWKSLWGYISKTYRAS